MPLAAQEAVPILPSPVATSYVEPFPLTAKTVPIDELKRQTGDVDNFVNLNDWQRVNPEKYYFFLGGGASVSSPAGLRAGYATNKDFGYMGIFFSGDIINANGGSNENSGLADGTSLKQTTTAWNDNIVLFYGNETIGAIRLDVLLTGTTNETITEGGDADNSSSNGNVTTSVGWGKNFTVAGGTLKPNATIGVYWGANSKFKDGGKDFEASGLVLTGTTPTGLNDTKLGVKLGATWAFGPRLWYSIGADWTLAVGLGGEAKYNGKEVYKQPGAVTNMINLTYNQIIAFNEKLTFNFRPNIGIGFSSQAYRNDADSVDNGTRSAFRLTPSVTLGAVYQIKPIIGIFAGAYIPFLSFYSATTKEGSDNDNDTKNLSNWRLAGIGWHGGVAPVGVPVSLGLSFAPLKDFGIDLSTTNTINLSTGKYTVDIVNWNGSILLVFKK
jgi:hypothetical protein